MKASFFNQEKYIMKIKPVAFFLLYVSVIIMCGCKDFKNSKENIEFQKGVDLYNKGDCENAKVKFEESIKKDPQLWEGYLYLANCALKKGAFQESLQLGQKASSIASGDTKSRDSFKIYFGSGGQAALGKGDYDNAILFLKEYVSLNKEDTSAHFLLGKALLERGKIGDMKAAIIEFKAGIVYSKNKDGDIAVLREIFFERAKKYSLAGNIPDALPCYLAYTENFDKNDVEAYVTIGRLMIDMRNALGALHYAKKAHALDPKNNGVRELLDQLNGPYHK
jgi:tetratricopeptide (TPR) repeat protein